MPRTCTMSTVRRVGNDGLEKRPRCQLDYDYYSNIQPEVASFEKSPASNPTDEPSQNLSRIPGGTGAKPNPTPGKQTAPYPENKELETKSRRTLRLPSPPAAVNKRRNQTSHQRPARQKKDATASSKLAVASPPTKESPILQ